MTKKKRKNLFAEITDTVIESLQGGIIPWEKPWSPEGLRDAPRSVSSGKVYNGSNWFWLELMRQAKGYSSPWWLTFKQAKNLGGSVRKGEKSSTAVFWKILSKDEEDEDGKNRTSSFPMLRSFAVFNVDQCDLPQEAIDNLASRLDRLAPKVSKDFQPIESAEHTIGNYIGKEGITLEHGGDRAFYGPSEDHIQMPQKQTFKAVESYYATLAHESVHSTGHSSRLARGFEKQAAFGSEDYSREELVAELGSSMVLSVLGISKPEIEKNRDAYIQNWIKALKDDERAIVVASGKAAKAAEMVLALDNEGDKESE